MELICPSCEARYRVPDGAIGSQGREVSCTNCGHGWRAEPPLELEPAMAVAGGRGAETLARRSDEAARAGTAEISQAAADGSVPPCAAFRASRHDRAGTVG